MHLFAGAGGGLLADLILGHTPIIAVEWDSYACQVLRERASEGWFPDLQVWEGDIRLFDPSDYEGVVDCIHAGFPCQDISLAGNQAGVGVETRSGLYREVIRIARVLRPRFLFLENVSAIVSNGLGTVVADLAALGYDVEWLCLRASDCGANHYRDRWWCLARHTDSINDREKRGVCGRPDTIASGVREDVADSDKTKPAGLRFRTEKEHAKPRGTSKHGDVADTMRQRQPGQGQPIHASGGAAGGEGQASDAVHERIGGFWQVEPDVGLLADGVSSDVVRRGGEEINVKTDNSTGQDLPCMRESIQSPPDAERSIANRETFQESNALQQDLREHKGSSHEARVFMESKEAPEAIMRGLRLRKEVAGASHRSGQDQQRPGQHPDAVQTLPRLLAHDGETDREGSSGPDAAFGWWQAEPNVGRVANGVAFRIHRLKALGNGQVPLQAAVAWKLLGGL